MAKRKPTKPPIEFETPVNPDEPAIIEGVSGLVDAIDSTRSEPTNVEELPPDANPPVNDSFPDAGDDAAEGNTVATSVYDQSLTDSEGAYWNEALHSPNKTKNRDGTWRKKSGRPVGGVVTDVSNEAVCLKAAENAAGQMFMLTQAFLGSEWEPIVNHEHAIDERKQVTNAIYEYFLVTGVVKLPPWLGLTVALGAYALPRFAMPGTQARIKFVYAKLTGKKVKDKTPAPTEVKANDRP